MSAAALVSDLSGVLVTPLDTNQVKQAGDQQAIALLDDLGYLQVSQNADHTVDTATLQQAVKQFRRELATSTIADAPAPSPDDSLSPEEADFIERVTSLDGDFKLEDFTLNTLAAHPLAMRSLNYRLSILGLAKNNINEGADFSTNTTDSLQTLTDMLSITKEDLLPLLSDFDELTRALLAKTDFLGSDYQGIAYFITHDDNTKGLKFRNQVSTFLAGMDTLNNPKLTQQRDIIRRAAKLSGGAPVGLKQSGANLIQPLCYDKVNRFFLRLLQIRLYMVGSYAATLDADMGKLSLQGIMKYVDMENHDEDDVKVDDGTFMVKINQRDSQQVWAINSKVLLEQLLTHSDAEEAEAAKQQGMAGHVQHLAGKLSKPAEKAKMYDNVHQKIKDRYGNDASQTPKRSQKSKGFFARIGSIFKKVFNAVIKGIEAVLDAIEKLFDWVVNGIEMLLDEIGKALSKLKTAIKFVFGSRTVTTGVLTTQFDMDFDAATHAAQPPDDQTITSHRQQLEAIGSAVTDSANFLEAVVPVIVDLLKPPFGWVAAAIELAKLAYQSNLFNPQSQ